MSIDNETGACLLLIEYVYLNVKIRVCSRGVREPNETHLLWGQRYDAKASANHVAVRWHRWAQLSNQIAERCYRQNVDSNPRRQGRVLQIFSSQCRCVS